MHKTSDSLRREIKELKAHLKEAEETLQAIRSGEVDALVTTGPNGDRIFTLEGAETPYRILVEEMNQGALMLSPDGTVLYANTRFSALSKTPLEQVIGSSWQKFFPTDYAQLAKCLKNARPARPHEELSLRASDATVYPVHLSLRSMVTNGVTGFSVLVTDLTERKQSENALRKTSDELLEKNGQLEAFSHSISHDMRAPLRAMQGFASIVLADYGDKLEATPKSLLERIVSTAQHLDRLIHDVLADSKLSHGQHKVGTFEVITMVKKMVENYPNLRESNIEIVPSSARVRGFEVALGQCISNLLCNAIKFVPVGRAPAVKVWTERNNGHTRLWVQDNGIGIRLGDQKRIFDIFSRVQTKKKYEGSGIGLSMVKTAVEKMGGHVGVESNPGHGSRFWIDLQSA